jgi:hypothetical protein|tara:strand:- start:1427 stop:1615 length:189 start_codon:yes stop_codon:yes gene_type:complete
MSDKLILERMKELSKPIDEAILSCDSREEILMLASLMQTSLKTIYDTQIGTEGRKKMFRDLV